MSDRTRALILALVAAGCVACTSGRGEPARLTVVHGRGEGHDRIYLRMNEAEFLGNMPDPDPGIRDTRGRILSSARRYAEPRLAKTGDCPAGFVVMGMNRESGPAAWVITVQCIEPTRPAP
jgi:hypothetical protein